jgi:hypothetical protein
MRTKFILAAIAASLTTVAAATPAEAGINQRQAKQQQRIETGIANGSLTAREVNRLQRQQGRISAYEARSRADGNGLTRKERLRIKAMQDRASANIYRQKHNAQRGKQGRRV